MKHIYLGAVFCVLITTACIHKPCLIGNGSFAACSCYTDTIHTTYGMGTTYNTADTTLYADSCSALKTQNKWDTCMVTRESL